MEHDDFFEDIFGEEETKEESKEKTEQQTLPVEETEKEVKPPEPTEPEETPEPEPEPVKETTEHEEQVEEKEESTTDEIFISAPKPKEFDLLPDRGTAKVVVTVVGRKGHGKTDVALSFPGKIAAISFDYKTTPVAEKRYPDRLLDISNINTTEELVKYVMSNNNKDWIIVWDGKRYFDEDSPETMLSSAETSMNYLLELLELIKTLKPDWVLIDGIHIFHFIAEMLMRYRNGLRPFQGVRDRNIWKERRMYLRQLHKAAINACQKGVIYTTYLGEVDLTIEEGEIVNRDELPNWIDVVHDETDTVIVTRQKWQDGVRKFVATVESNKRKILPFKEGVEIDVTNKNAYNELLKT